MPQAHCWYCDGPKNGPTALEAEAPCATCLDRMAEVEEIFEEPPPENAIFLVARWFAYREFRYFLILYNNGCFYLHKARCQIGIGSREINPEITTLKQLWQISYSVGTHIKYNAESFDHLWGAGSGWPSNYWPTTQDIFLAINANLILCARRPNYDAWLP